MSHAIHLYQIAYSAQIMNEIEPGYLVLDNLDNSRPDWREYWPMRNFLLTRDLDEDAFYGIFSPKFGSKTLLSYEHTRQCIAQVASRADVVLFSPQPDMGAFFLNVFEQGETFDPGFIEVFERFLEQIGRKVDLRGMVMDFRQIVFSNFFVARPAFWRAWFEFSEKLYAICEGPDSPLQRLLTQPTNYGDGVPRKVFMLERLATFLLATQPEWQSVAIDPFPFCWSMTKFREYPDEAIISDALKLASREQGYPEYLQVFGRLRQRCFVNDSPAPKTMPSQPATATAALASGVAGLRQIVKNYKIVTNLISFGGGHKFSGDSAANKRIVEHLFPNDVAPKTVLDIGFGVGSLGMLLNQHPQLQRWVIDGIDGFQETCSNIALFEKGIYRNIWHGLAQELTYEQLSSYDVICLLDVIEHLPPDVAKNLLASLLTSLGEESKLVVSTPLWFYPQDQQKNGDLEEHLIGIPIQSMLDLQPIMYSIGTVALVGNFVFSKKSQDHIDKFRPTTDKSFSMQQGFEQVQAQGLRVDNKVYYL